jgi:hypothetical protein
VGFSIISAISGRGRLLIEGAGELRNQEDRHSSLFFLPAGSPDSSAIPHFSIIFHADMEKKEQKFQSIDDETGKCRE